MTVSIGQVATASDVLALPQYTADGTYILALASTTVAQPSTSYELRKIITVAGGGTFRIQFDLLAGGSPSIICYGRVYQNASAIGTEQTNTTSSWVTKSEDITGWYPGDLCQLYTKGTVSGLAALAWRNFRITASTNKSEFQVFQDG